MFPLISITVAGTAQDTAKRRSQQALPVPGERAANAFVHMVYTLHGFAFEYLYSSYFISQQAQSRKLKFSFKFFEFF